VTWLRNSIISICDFSRYMSVLNGLDQLWIFREWVHKGPIRHAFKIPWTVVLKFITIIWKGIENKTISKQASVSLKRLETVRSLTLHFFLGFIKIYMNSGFNHQPTSMSHLHRFCVLLVVLHATTHTMRQRKQKSSESFMCCH